MYLGYIEATFAKEKDKKSSWSLTRPSLRVEQTGTACHQLCTF